MREVALVLSCSVLLACSPSAGAGRAIWVEPLTGMTFRHVDAGRFEMGSPPSEADREDQESLHHVTLSHPFWLGTFEVTQSEWRQVMSTSPSRFTGARRPVEGVTWFEVQEFLRILESRSPGSHFRLPSEAEWEYACRAGSSEPYATGASLNAGQANVFGRPGGVAGNDGATMAVGSFAPNAWGFHDMHGNVWEWTADEHCPYPDGPAVDPLGACGAELRVIRGGSWYFAADSARCALRYTHRPQDRGFSLGFRVVREERR